MLAASNYQQHRGTDAARNGGVRAFMGGMRRLASVADDKAQNGHRPVSVREASHLSLPAGLTRFLPCQTGGGFTRSRLFSIRRCAWRAANTQFSRRLVQSCAHQFRMGHEPGSDVAYPLHVERLSCGVVAMSQHCTSGVANGRKAVVGERNV
jgi:hypothetical protein